MRLKTLVLHLFDTVKFEGNIVIESRTFSFLKLSRVKSQMMTRGDQTELRPEQIFLLRQKSGAIFSTPELTPAYSGRSKTTPAYFSRLKDNLCMFLTVFLSYSRSRIENGRYLVESSMLQVKVISQVFDHFLFR